MIHVDRVVKRYGKFTAVDDVSLEVGPGEIHEIGRATLTFVDLELDATATPVLVGTAAPAGPFSIALPKRDGSGPGCWSRPGRSGDSP